jgi:hypothetical protein
MSHVPKTAIVDCGVDWNRLLSPGELNLDDGNHLDFTALRSLFTKDICT